MPLSESDLNTNEKIILDLRPHWSFFARPAGALLAALTVGLVAFFVIENGVVSALAGLLILAALVWLGIKYVMWTTTAFIVTTDRLISRTGVLSREGIEIPLERINTVLFRQTLLERLLRTGDLEIESASEQGSSGFSDIRRPLNVQNEIYRQMEANENRKFDRVGQNLGGTSPSSIPDQIDKLDDLRRRGVLTEEEFQEKKAELLRRL